MSKTRCWGRYRSPCVPSEYTRSRRLLCLLGALATTVCGASPASDQIGKTRRVLVISSYHEGDSWNDPLVRGIQAVLAGGPHKIDADFEYLDSRRHPEPAYAQLFVQYLHHKFASGPPELIVAADDPAVHLVLQYRGGLLPAVPVVFCGVNEYHGTSAYVTDHPEQRPWLAGVLEPIDIDATVDLALELHPDRRELIILGDNVHYETDIQTRHPGLQVRRLNVPDLSFQELWTQLDQLGRADIVLLTRSGRDRTGATLGARQVAAQVALHSPVPIYTVDWPVLGLGPVGGKMADPYLQGQTAASMALSILGGVSPSSLGIQRNLGAVFEFDFNLLNRWKISEDRLPRGSIVIHRPVPFGESHPWLVGSFCIFLGIQTLVIGILLIQRKRRRMAEDTLRKHSLQLANSNYMLEQFAYITAHDFQEPIRSVALFAELLRSGSMDRLDDEGRQAVEFIFENSRRVHSMVRGLLAWVRSVEAPPDSLLWCDTNRVWREVMERYRDLIRQDAVIIHSGRLPSVAVHPHHMRELLSRLLENALQHANVPDLTISIRSERADNSWKVTLFNSGQPIPKALQSRVFGVFRRLQNSVPGKTNPGVGMGLAICRRIVDFYGGRIWVEGGAGGQGCAFCFTLPDTPRPRARRPQRGLLNLSFSSTHAHSDH